MTTIYLSDKDGKHRIRCEDHATGSEAVCGGISAICCTLVVCAVEPQKLVIESGFFDIEFADQEELFRFAKAGFEGIREAYSDYCKIIYK